MDTKFKKALESNLYSKNNNFAKVDLIHDWYFLYNFLDILDIHKDVETFNECLKLMLAITNTAYRKYGKKFIDKYHINTNFIVDVYDSLYPNLLNIDYIYSIF